MPDLEGNLTKGDGKTRLEGKVWLGQKRGQWPVTVLDTEANVLYYLGDKDAAVWEYELTPVRRVRAVTPEPYLEEHDGSSLPQLLRGVR